MAEEIIIEKSENGGEGARERGPLSLESQSGREQIPALEHEPRKEGREGQYNELLSKLNAGVKSTPVISDAEVAKDAQAVSLGADEESRIRHLVDLAHAKGPVHAVRVARSLQDYYALDRMHDELSDAFFRKLGEEGLL